MDPRSGATSLAARFPRSALHPAAVEHANASASRGETWCVAVSGGADSVALLALLWALWPEQRGHLRVLHFNHRLRGEESEGDELFCRAVAAAFGTEFFARTWVDRPLSVSEDDAREARLRFFAECVQTPLAGVLFTGHQRDDIAETQLMRLSRGAAAGGLAAPRPLRRWQGEWWIARPLLTLDRAEVRSALVGCGLDWREDSTNTGTTYLRNRIRCSVVPSWIGAAGAGALEGAALSRSWLEEDDDALEWMLDELGLPKASTALDLRPLLGKPAALWRRGLRRWTPASSLSRSGYAQLLELCRTASGRMSVGDGFAAVCDGWLRFEVRHGSETPWDAVLLAEGASTLLPDGARVSCRRSAVDRELMERLQEGRVDPSTEAWIDVSGRAFSVRPWRAGDRYRPLGAPGSAKVQDLFTNRKIPEDDRHHLPVVCSEEGSILWIPGLPPADGSKLTSQSVTAVQLTYSRGTITVRKQS